MNVSEVQKLVRQWWWILILCPLVAAAATYLISSSTLPIYRAQALLLIEHREDSATSDYNSILAAERRTRTYSLLVEGRAVVEETINRLGLGTTPEALMSEISVDPVRDTQLVSVAVNDPSPNRAATIANTLSDVFIEQMDDVQSNPAGSQMRLAEPAVPPDSPVSPRTTLNTGMAGFLGLALAFGLVFGIAYLDDTVKTTDDVRQLSGRGALGLIPVLDSPQGIEAISDPHSLATEGYRGLRTNLQFATVSRQTHSLVATSVRPEEGKTTTLANLGTVLAQGGQSVILLDADLRKPSLHNLFDGISNRSGLSNLFLTASEDFDPNNWVQPTNIPGLRILTAGPLPPNPPDLLGSNRMKEILARLEGDADIILIDTPPLAMSDALIMTGIADGTLLVASSGQTRSTELTQAIQNLGRTDTPLVGVVLNRVNLEDQGYYSYYYYQGYYGDSDHRTPGGKRDLRARSRARRAVSNLTARLSGVDDPGS